MHVRPLAALVATTVVLAAGCGQAAGGDSSSPPPPPSSSSVPGHVRISGVLYATTSAHPHGGKPLARVMIGIFTRPFSTAGPLMADPPSPIATARTDTDGHFSIEFQDSRPRYFVSAIDARGYAPGRWARPGAKVRLATCTNCPIPL
jgi:hypothetical protein